MLGAEGGGPAQTGPGNAPGRARVAPDWLENAESVRDTNGLKLSPRQKQSPPSPAPGRLSATPAGFWGYGARSPEEEKGSREPEGALETCEWHNPQLLWTARGERGRYPIRPTFPLAFSVDSTCRRISQLQGCTYRRILTTEA